MPGIRKALPSRILQQQRECAIEDLGEIAVADGVAQQILHFLQLVSGLLADRELNVESFGREWLHERPR